MPLQVSTDFHSRVAAGEITANDASRFENFVQRCNSEFMTHEVITNNEYCHWFAQGGLNLEDVRHMVVQFSVFSNLFLIAQMHKVINAGSIESMRASKEILANEIGVSFNSSDGIPAADGDHDREGDPDIVSIEGSVDGGTFRFRAAHFEWLVRMGSKLGVGFDDMGKRRHGTPATLFFCDELTRIYGNEDPNIAEGASFAVENWAAAGFWKQLVAGLEDYKKRELPDLPLAFFTWHDRIEEQHAGHVMDELEEAFFTLGFDEDKFIRGGIDMLGGVNAYWVGHNEERITRHFQNEAATNV